MAQDNINSLKELYLKVTPALKTKKEELKRNRIRFITEKMIWDYLKNNIWYNKDNLSLYDIVDDILSLDEIALINYLNGGKK